MNTTVAIVLPQWAVWVLILIFLLNIIEHGLKIYSHFLRDKLARRRAASIGKSIQKGE